MENEKFDLHCIVELFGHNRIAGRCTEQNVAGTNMLRVDVPETKKNKAFTRILSAGAIYAINPVSEDIAKAVAETLNVAPITPYAISEMVKDEILKIPAHSTSDDGIMDVDFEDPLF
ncbi:hypothetical protein [Proteiniphilum acetatigenes]|uniref:hypothetical protein n=1 Tax=Proteiniphilum acetatigenes TaxID=294710 RepID=UPI00037FEE1C|nr:hypothetical protein [Proteiniphilum acetatigenes]